MAKEDESVDLGRARRGYAVVHRVPCRRSER